jgi:carboxymethylenebutenolidase
MPTGALLTWITPSPAVTCTEDAAGTKLDYKSGGRSYSGNLFRPTGSGPFPAMLVLHTSIGLFDHELAYGQWLADQGYVALVPDYFASVGVTSGTLDMKTFQADAVREDLARAIDCLRSLAYVDKTRVGTVGFSLGGYFALALGTREDVRAVVAYYAGACDPPVDQTCLVRYPIATVAAQMRAPVLLLHGQADNVSPFAYIRATQDILQRAGKTSELVPYPGVGHAFDFTNRAASPNYNPPATANAKARVLAFLQQTLH